MIPFMWQNGTGKSPETVNRWMIARRLRLGGGSERGSVEAQGIF